MATEERRKRKRIKIKGVVNVGYLLKKIKESGCTGIDEAAALCHVDISNFYTLLEFTGELPQLSALFRICEGLKADLEQLIPCVPETGELLRKIEAALERLPGPERI